MRVKMTSAVIFCVLLAIAVVGCAGSGEYPKSAASTSGQTDPASFDALSVTIPDTGATTFTVSVNTLTWRKINSSVATFLTSQGTVAADDATTNALYNITTEASAATPDLSSVTGVGIYIQDSTYSTTKWVITQLQLTGDASVVETFTVDSVVTVVNYNYASTVATSTATGWTWDGHIKTVTEGSTDKTIYLGGTSNPLRLLKDGHANGAYVWGLMSSGTTVTSVANLTSFTITSAAAASDKSFTDNIRFIIQDANGDWYLSVGGGTATVTAL